MDYDLIVKKGKYKGFKYVLKMDDSDCVELTYRGVSHSGRLLYDIFKIGGITKYIEDKFREEDFETSDNDIHRTDLRFMTSGNGFDKHTDLGM